MGTIIRNNVVYGSSSNVIELSMADYEAREAAGGIDSDVMYFIPDAEEYANVSANTNISDFFSISKDYVTGDYCIYNNQLYEFIADKPAGSWDESVVITTTIINSLEKTNDSVEQSINSVDMLNIRYDTSTGYIQLYYNGAWNNWMSGGGSAYANPVIYSNGTINDELCGGFSALAATVSGSGTHLKVPTVTYNSDSMKITSDYDRTGAVFTVLPIDLTNYRYVKVVAEGYTATTAAVKASLTKKNGYTTAKSASLGNGTITLNVSGLTGEYYILFQVYWGSVTIKSIELVA